jgi:hypothetical protein
MGRYLGVELTNDPAADTTVIQATLCGALRQHSTIVIQLTNWDALGSQNQHEFMQWLLETFWQPLVDELEAVLEDWDARVIFVIVANRPLSKECRQLPCFCTVDAFDSRSILHHFRLSKPETKRWTRQIYEESEGDPTLTRKTLQDYFEQLLASQSH